MVDEPVTYDDEVDLRALVATLWKWKNLVLGVTGLAIGLAVILSTWVLTPVYESEARFFLPSLGELGMSPDQYADYALSDVVIEPLLAATDPGATMDGMRERLSVELTTGKTVLVLTASASSAEESQHLTSLWLESFTGAVQSYVSRRLDQALLETEANVAAMRAGLEAVGGIFQLAPAEREQALEIAAAVAYGDAYAAALREQARLRELKASLSTRAVPELLLAPTLPQQPSSPRTLLNVVVAGVLGFMMGTFVAFGVEWWRTTAHHEGRHVA